jgi:hypothetical protein
MTVNGSGKAKAAMRSTRLPGPWAAMWSRKSSTMACTQGRGARAHHHQPSAPWPGRSPGWPQRPPRPVTWTALGVSWPERSSWIRSRSRGWRGVPFLSIGPWRCMGQLALARRRERPPLLRRQAGDVTAGLPDPALQRPVIERVAGHDDDPAHRPARNSERAHAQPGNSSACPRRRSARSAPPRPHLRSAAASQERQPAGHLLIANPGRPGGRQASPQPRRRTP